MRISLTDAACRKARKEIRPAEALAGQVARFFHPNIGHSPVALPRVPHVLTNSRPSPAGALVPRAALILLRACGPLVRAAGELPPLVSLVFVYERFEVMSERQELLTAWDQYRSTILDNPPLPDDEMRQLAAQAGTGDAGAKELLIKYCLRYILYDSAKYIQFVYNYDEHMDLIGAANEKVAAVLDVALTKRDPMPYIRAAIRNSLIDQSTFYKKFIKQTTSLEVASVADKLTAETQLPEQAGEHPQASKIREALNALTEKQRYVIQRHFGLDGDAPESLYSLSKRLSTTGGNTRVAQRHLAGGLNRLRRILAE